MKKNIKPLYSSLFFKLYRVEINISYIKVSIKFKTSIWVKENEKQFALMIWLLGVDLSCYVS